MVDKAHQDFICKFKFTFTHTFEVWTCYASSSHLKRLPSPFVHHRSRLLTLQGISQKPYVKWSCYVHLASCLKYLFDVESKSKMATRTKYAFWWVDIKCI